MYVYNLSVDTAILFRMFVTRVVDYGPKVQNDVATHIVTFNHYTSLTHLSTLISVYGGG